MKVNFLQPVTDIKGEEIKGPDEKPIILEKLCIESLLAELVVNQRAESLTGEQKLKNYELAQRIAEACKTDGVLNLKTEEIALIKQRAGIALQTMYYGALCHLIEK